MKSFLVFLVTVFLTAGASAESYDNCKFMSTVAFYIAYNRDRGIPQQRAEEALIYELTRLRRLSTYSRGAASSLIDLIYTAQFAGAAPLLLERLTLEGCLSR